MRTWHIRSRRRWERAKEDGKPVFAVRFLMHPPPVALVETAEGEQWELHRERKGPRLNPTIRLVIRDHAGHSVAVADEAKAPAHQRYRKRTDWTLTVGDSQWWIRQRRGRGRVHHMLKHDGSLLMEVQSHRLLRLWHDIEIYAPIPQIPAVCAAVMSMRLAYSPVNSP